MAGRVDRIMKLVRLFAQLDVPSTLRLWHTNQQHKGWGVYVYPGMKVATSNSARIEGEGKLYIGDRFFRVERMKGMLRMASNSHLVLEGKNHLMNGPEIAVADGATLNICGGVFAREHVQLMASGGTMTIGRNCYLSQNVRIDGAVTIEDNVWIGQNTIVRGTITIPANTVIGSDEIIEQ